ncbi:MAG: hypothetical protein ABW221_19415 [Vicinamibacteria bacterium]
MRVSLPGISMLGIGLLASLGPVGSAAAGGEGKDGTREKLIVASGRVALDLDVQKLGEAASAARRGAGRVGFEAERDAFLTFVVFNGALRGPLPGSMRILPQEGAALPASLNGSRDQLVVENASWGAAYDMAVRDGSTGFLYFDVEGQEYSYEPKGRALGVHGGRLLISKEFAKALGRPEAAGTVAGGIEIDLAMRPIEVSHVVDGELREEVLPGLDASLGGVPGPDVIVGDLNGLAQFGGTNGTQVGLAVGTDSCNAGVVNLNWFALPSNDHPVIPQNLYRMSGGASNNNRFEQIGQSNVKHAFEALTQNLCGFGCNGVGGVQLGSGCSDPYVASLNAGPDLGSRAWINPFTGAFPAGNNVANSHAGHSHNGPSHRILTDVVDLNTSLNAGATYYAEAQYVTPHEWAWCSTHPGECNMYNNVSYRRYNVSGTASPFSFTPNGSTVRMQPALSAWTGATVTEIRPTLGTDGVGAIGYKVTNPSPGVWHYEYAIYNQNLDRAIQAFSLPKPDGVTISNFGFHAPRQHPGWAADGTVGNTGFSNTPWTQSEADGRVTWSSETLAQNPNANAVRWGTLYNVWFDSNRPPGLVTGSVTFFKTGTRLRVAVQGPSAP